MNKYILLISGIIAVGLSTYFSILPLNDVSQKDISDMYQTLITPASYTFSIWSIIYISWIILGLVSIFEKPSVPLRKILLLASTQIISAFWLVPWHYDFIAMSLVIMLGLFSILLYLCVSREETTLFQGVCDLFFGWIIIATIANIHVFLVAYELYSQGLIYSVSSIVAGVALNYYLYTRYTTIIPTFVLVWALFGILVLQSNNYIIITCICGIVFSLSTIILYFIHADTK